MLDHFDELGVMASQSYEGHFDAKAVFQKIGALTPAKNEPFTLIPFHEISGLVETIRASLLIVAEDMCMTKGRGEKKTKALVTLDFS